MSTKGGQNGQIWKTIYEQKRLGKPKKGALEMFDLGPTKKQLKKLKKAEKRKK